MGVGVDGGTTCSYLFMYVRHLLEEVYDFLVRCCTIHLYIRCVALDLIRDHSIVGKSPVLYNWLLTCVHSTPTHRRTHSKHRCP